MKPLILFITLLALASCSKTILKVEIPGTYKANHKLGLDTIEILDNGLYKHTLQGANGTIITKQDKWELDTIDNEKIVSFYNFDLLGAKFSGGQGSIWPVRPELKGGKISFEIDEDRNYYYIRE